MLGGAGWCQTVFRLSRFARPRTRDSGARAGRVGIRRAVGVDVERPRSALDDLLRDHHFLDPLEARQVEHGVEQDSLHDRAQPPRAGLALVEAMMTSSVRATNSAASFSS